MTTTTELPPAVGGAELRRSWPVGRWLLRLAIAPFAVWAAARGFGVDRFDSSGLIAAPIAFTPYVAAASVLPLAAALIARRWREAAVAALVVAAFAGFVVPRVVAGAAPPAGGTPLRVLTVNMQLGEASTDEILELVRRERPDLVSIQELTEDAVSRLDAAGIATLLPHRALRPYPLASGTGLYARYPLTNARAVDKRSKFAMTRATLRSPAGDVDVVAAHPAPPIPGGPSAHWNRDLRLLPTAPSADGTPTVLAGDFNASLDHALLRSLLDTGYSDAAASVGEGLLPTWPQDRSLPSVSIDRVLVGGRIAARAVRGFDLPGSDHRAVFAELTIQR